MLEDSHITVIMRAVDMEGEFLDGGGGPIRRGSAYGILQP